MSPITATDPVKNRSEKLTIPSQLISENQPLSYIMIFARFSYFIREIKKLFGLDDAAIYEILMDPYSNLKDSLHANLVYGQTDKTAVDLIEKFMQHQQSIDILNEKIADLEDRGFSLDSPIPDLNFIRTRSEESQEKIENSLAELAEIRLEQKEMDEKFLTEIKKLYAQFQEMLKEKGIKLESIQHTKLFWYTINKIREKGALDYLKRSGHIDEGIRAE